MKEKENEGLRWDYHLDWTHIIRKRYPKTNIVEKYTLIWTAETWLQFLIFGVSKLYMNFLVTGYNLKTSHTKPQGNSLLKQQLSCVLEALNAFLLGRLEGLNNVIETS